jgi:citrate synthase
VVKEREAIRTRIWREEAEPDNPFAAAACYCHGYDVYGDVLGKAGWMEFLYLLFKGERPSRRHCRLLEDLAVAIANPGPRDHSIRAAMNGGVGGSNSAACLMAALGVGAGQLGGAREVAIAMQLWLDCGTDIETWRRRLEESPTEERADVWPPMEHPPGFDPHGASCPTPVRQVLHHLSNVAGESAAALCWLRQEREALEAIADCPLAMTGVAAAAFHDLKFSPDQGEMLYLLLRLPGAAVHALEQKEFGFKRYPFFKNAVHLADDPGPFGKTPAVHGES